MFDTNVRPPHNAVIVKDIISIDTSLLVAILSFPSRIAHPLPVEVREPDNIYATLLSPVSPPWVAGPV
jgi:hypothetical protein